MKAKTVKIALIAEAAVCIVAAACIGYGVYDEIDSRAENEEELDSALEGSSRYARQEIFPNRGNLAQLQANRDGFAAWRATARELAGTGDMSFDPTTPPAFKTFMLEEARRLAAMPGNANGRLVKENFGFGFAEYITGSSMPSAKDLPRLQREWYDVSSVLETLATAGAGEILSVEVKRETAKAADEDEAKPSKKGKKGAAKAAAKELPPSATTFTVVFDADPAALVKALNALAVHPRFVVVDDFAFGRDKDDLAEKLSGPAEKKEATSARRRSRRGAAAAAAEEENKDTRSGFITDPEHPVPFKVTLTVSVYDFNTRAAGAQAEEVAE